jgi:hypothetical protein
MKGKYMLALGSEITPSIMTIDKNQLYGILVSNFLSENEWIDSYQAPPNIGNRILVEEFFHKCDLSRYSDMCMVLDRYIPNIIQSRLESTILSNKNNLDMNPDDLWMIVVKIILQSNQGWDHIKTILNKITYQTLPLAFPKYIMIPSDIAKSLNYTIKQKLKDIKISNQSKADLPSKINYYPKSISQVLLQRPSASVIKDFLADITNVILSDSGRQSCLYATRLISSENQSKMLEPLLRQVFDILNLSVLLFVEKEIDPITIIHQKNMQLAFEKLGGLYRKQNHFNQFSGLLPNYFNSNLTIPLSTQDDDNQNLQMLNDQTNVVIQQKQKSILKNDGVQKALLGGAAIGLTYLLLNSNKDEAYDDDD